MAVTRCSDYVQGGRSTASWKHKKEIKRTGSIHKKTRAYIDCNKRKNGVCMGRSLKQKMTEVSELPKDVVMGMPVLTMTGQQELCIENYRGIIEYTDTVARIQTKIGQIKVMGKNLKVAYYTNDEMMINGRITGIEYQH